MQEPEHIPYFSAHHASGRFTASYAPVPAHKGHPKAATAEMLIVGVHWKQPGKQMNDNKIMSLIN